MSETKLVVNNATLIRQPNGDLSIKPRRLRSAVGLVLGIPLAIFALFSLIGAFSDGFSFIGLLWALGLGYLAYAVSRSSLRDLRTPGMTVEKSTGQVTKGVETYPLSGFSGVGRAVSGYLNRSRKDEEAFQIFQVGLVTTSNQFFPLVETGFKQRDRAIAMIAEATGLPDRQN